MKKHNNTLVEGQIERKSKMRKFRTERDLIIDDFIFS